MITHGQICEKRPLQRGDSNTILDARKQLHECHPDLVDLGKPKTKPVGKTRKGKAQKLEASLNSEDWGMG